jgi:hypothetical protein
MSENDMDSLKDRLGLHLIEKYAAPVKKQKPTKSLLDQFVNDAYAAPTAMSVKVKL